ncbi:hypothetical protein CC78DRAFT_582140 [Lojkania enalia]|uniref:DUF6590 domain-containing protein n=1 Tax=Lojkania enalia TaxID=147567 RepID=A0A9P4K659_9PLEO|nr:hypothetical protein CC78DRAFT_582140 [Didymosphaeria enalia]
MKDRDWIQVYPLSSNQYPTNISMGYAVRNVKFFTIGRVFSILSTDGSGNFEKRDPANVFSVLFGEKVYSTIARFVCVQNARGFCYACPVLTYGGQGTLKSGCDPQEHSIMYLRGDVPTLLPGEKSLQKEPIEIVPAASDRKILDHTSRIRFGRGQAIQYNVKAKDIGHVSEEHIPLLVRYWREEMGMDCPGSCSRVAPYVGKHAIRELGDYVKAPRDINSPKEALMNSTNPGDTDDKVHIEENRLIEPMQENAPWHSKSSETLLPFQESQLISPRRHTFRTDETEYVMITEVPGRLHSGFQPVHRPRAYFKRGRIFMVLWPELAGNPETERTIYWKIRRFVVIRPKSSHCLCLPIHTYGGKATTKAGISAQEHAPLIPIGTEVELYEGEQSEHEPLYMKAEDPTIPKNGLSRVNFGDVCSIKHHIKVRNVGRLLAESLKRLEGYFSGALRVDNA